MATKAKTVLRSTFLSLSFVKLSSSCFIVKSVSSCSCKCIECLETMIYCVEILVPLLLLNIIKFTHSGLAISLWTMGLLLTWDKIKDGAYYCYCAYVLRISRYSDFLSPMLTNTGIFLRGLKLSGESRS